MKRIKKEEKEKRMHPSQRWEENWKKGWIPFHRHEVNPALIQYFPEVLKNSVYFLTKE